MNANKDNVLRGMSPGMGWMVGPEGQQEEGNTLNANERVQRPGMLVRKHCFSDFSNPWLGNRWSKSLGF